MVWTSRHRLTVDGHTLSHLGIQATLKYATQRNGIYAMINIVTVHWKDDRWIDIQLEYLRRNITDPFRVFAFLNFVPDRHRCKFYYCSTEEIESHAAKLNLLADMVALHSTDENDWLMFLDGDALPIRNVVPYGREKLRRFPLIAIQRHENVGDVQPHPSFCLTTVGFWKEIGGDWNEGFKWRDKTAQLVTDVGGNLLRILNEKKIEWHRMLRSNRTNWHPLWFGIYDDMIYHHGAGFRRPVSRIDVLHAKGDIPSLPLRQRVYRKFYSALPKRFAWRLRKPLEPVDERAVRSAVLSEKAFDLIASGPDFYRHFEEPEHPAEALAVAEPACFSGSQTDHMSSCP